ncbi:MAG: hypothetical protein JWO53_376, partial [Chlamydiia bacterium]|nr:hypothetical protein [Chlamydiia bacterium]
NIRELAIRNCPVLTSVSVEYMRKLKSLTTLKTANELVSRIPCNKYPHGKIKELELQNINGGELHGLQAPLEKLTLINCPSLDQARLNSLPSTLRELAIIYTESSSSIAQTYFYSVIERQELPLLEKLEIISYESIPLRSWSHFQRMKNLKSFTYILKNPSLTTICLPLENGPRSLTHLHRSTVVTFNPRNVSRVYPVLQSLILENIQVVDYQMQELQQHLMNLPLQALAIPRPPDATNDEILEFATALAARQKLSVTSNESNADQIKFTLG